MISIIVAFVAVVSCAVLGGLLWKTRRSLVLAQGALQDQLQKSEDAAKEQQNRLTHLEKIAREQLAVEIVLGNLLVEKGVFDEEEIEDAHRRLVIEPALMDEEHEALLADLPDQEGMRQRMIRNLPLTLQ